jgi:glycosyltransferase involved in cell wall biosynthesis
MRILHVLPHLGPGGSERVVADLVECQRENRDDPRLCVLGRCLSRSLPYGLAPEALLGFSGSLKDVRGMMGCFLGLRSVVQSVRPDVLHAHLWPAALFGSAMSVLSSIPCIVHIHDARPWLTSQRSADGMQRAVYRPLLDFSGAWMIAVADAVRQYTADNLGWRGRPIRVVHNGIDTTYFRRRVCRSARKQVLTIGSVGRLEAE